MLAKCFLWSETPANAAIGTLVFWLCNLIVPLQLLAALDLAGLSSPLNLNHLFLCDALVFACVLTYWWRRAKVPATRVRGGISLRPWPLTPWHVTVGLLLILCVYVALAARMAFTYPDRYDAMAYHYPVALRWLQEGTLRINPGFNWHASMPGNVELLALLVMSPGRERLLGLVEWPGLVILALACRSLASRIGRSGLAVWPVVTTVLMIPMVAVQSTSGYVDLFCTALLFASLSLALDFFSPIQGENKSPRLGLLVVAGLGCGLAMGAKAVYWLYAGLLIVAVVFQVLRSARDRNPHRWRAVALFLAAAALPSVFWFARGIACTGNPLFPFSVRLGLLVLPGLRPSDMNPPNFYLNHVRHWAEWFIYPWMEWKSTPGMFGTNYTTDDGLGGAFATFVMPGVLFAGWLVRRRRPDLRVWLVALLVLAILWWFFLAKVLRYGLPLLVLAALLSAPFFEMLERRPARAYRFVYVLAFAITAFILMFAPVCTMAQTVRLRRWSRAAYYHYPAQIDALKPGSKVLNLAKETLNYPLAGKGLSNRVVPSWEVPPRLTPEFLRSRRIDYVVETMRTPSSMMVDRQPPVEGLRMHSQSNVPDGDQFVRWWIWSTEVP